MKYRYGHFYIMGVLHAILWFVCAYPLCAIEVSKDIIIIEYDNKPAEDVEESDIKWIAGL
jgi:hypothetical protein